MSETAEANTKALIADGHEARRKNELERAKKAFQQAVNLSREEVAGNPAGLQEVFAQALIGLGQIERDLGQIPAALQHYQEAAEIYRSLQQPLALADTVRHVADILRQNGDTVPAAARYDEALAIYRDQPDTNALDLANTLRGYALLKADAGHPQAAIVYWQEARGLYEKAAVETGLDLKAAFDEIDRQVSRLSGL